MTTVAELLDYLRGDSETGGDWEPPLAGERVNYGLVSQLDPPLMSVTDFAATPIYDTSGVVYRELTFSVHTFAKNLATSEELMGAYRERLGLVEGSKQTVPGGIGGFEEGYAVVQGEDFLFEASMAVKLFVRTVEAAVPLRVAVEG